MLLRLASIATADPGLKHEICTGELDALPEQVAANSSYEAFNDMMAEYLDRYGFRCMNELKLEEFSLRDRPEMVYQGTAELSSAGRSVGAGCRCHAAS